MKTVFEIPRPFRSRSKRALKLALFVCVIVGFTGQPAAAPSQPGEQSLHVACVGDSITDGYQMPDKAHNAYPAQLARLLGASWEVRNFGVSGATLMRLTGYPYDERPAYGAALAWKPDIVVVALGTNDTKVENIGARPADFIPSYRALIAAFRAANPRVKIFLCLPPPAFPEAMGISDNVLQREILPRIRQVAAEEKLPLIDLHSPLENDAALFPDKIHPTAEGAARIAQLVYGELTMHYSPPPNRPVK
jgi:lysophospholipase L1-like esterase